MKKIILASQSPRRKEILQIMGLNFICKPVKAEEYFLPREEPQEAAKRIAKQKAEIAAGSFNDGIVIAADTIVEYNGKVLGKPVDENDAFSKLAFLSGNSHRVITAVCVKDIVSNKCEVDAEITKVYFRNISAKEIWSYIATGEPMDKAGAYGIQGLGAVFVEKIEGCYFNVVGLPLSRLYTMLKLYGIDVPGGYHAG